MEVDNWEPEWLKEEEGYRLHTSPPTISKRWQCRGLGPLIEILAFTSIEDLEKTYLVCSPSNSLTDPTFHREREGVVNRITMEHIMMKNRILEPSLSILLPPPGEPAVPFPWRPVLEHLENLPGIEELLTVGDPSLSQMGQLPHPLG